MQTLQVREYTRTLRVHIETADGRDIEEMEARNQADAFIASRWPEEWWHLDYSEQDTSDSVVVVYVQ